MNDVLGTVYLEWSPTRSGVVVCGHGRRSRPVKVDDVPAAVGSTDTVVVRHIDGPHLAVAALSAVRDGKARVAQVESDYGYRTTLQGTALKTLHVWATSDPTSHPAYAATRYGNADDLAVAAVIGNLFDPKWFVNPERPDRRAAVESRFGLTKRWDGKQSVFRRCLTRCWNGTPLEELDDHNFFGRMYVEAFKNRKSSAAAERVVGRYFVKCLLAAWADADRPCGAEPIFDPRLMFDERARRAVLAKGP